MHIRRLQNAINKMETAFPFTLLYILTFCFAMLTTPAGAIPSLSNVKAEQDADTKLVNITYDVEDVDAGPLEIKVYISENNGETFGIQAQSVSGDVGRGIPQGKGKNIVWDATQDVGTIYGTTYLVKITAKNPQATLPETITAKDSAEMVLAPTGSFLMGSTEGTGNQDEHPQHSVSLDAYYIDQFEVTNAQYAEFMNATGHPAPRMWGQPQFDKPNLPVVGITWFDAQAYSKWAKKRLPTEAEWEKAARGTDGRIFPWGNDSDTEKANVEMSIGRLTDVGSYPAGVSPYGVHDMAGNVFEWVADWYDANYYLDSPDENPPGPETGQYRILRGGSWLDTWWGARCANRGDTVVSPDTWRIDVGFRCVMDAGVVDVLSKTFSLDTREEAIATLVGHTEMVDSLAFNPESNLLVSGGNWDANGIRLWDVKTWKTIRTFPNDHPVYSVKFSPDGMKIASASFDHTVKLWDVITGNLIWKYTDTNQLNWVDFSSDGKLIAVAAYDNTARLLDASNGKEVKRFSMPTSIVLSVEFHPSGRLLSSVSKGGNIVVWDIITEEKIKTFGPGTATTTDFSPDGRFLAFGLNNKLKVWNIETDELRTFGNIILQSYIGFSPDGEVLATTSSKDTLVFWDVETGNRLSILMKPEWKVPLEYMYAHTFSGNLFAAAAKEATIHVWDVSKYLDSSKFTRPEEPLPSEPTFTLSLAKGLNLISLPLEPATPYTAQTLLVQLGATVVLRFDVARQTFVAYIPDISPDFPIEGGQGYIVNLLESKEVSLTGTAWDDTTTAPSIVNNQVWAFAIGGRLSDDISAHKIMIENPRAQWVIMSEVEHGGRFSAAYVDMNRKAVVKVGDKLAISLLNASNQQIGTISQTITPYDLERASLLVEFHAKDFMPTKTYLLQNYPNPFNPETWIPYQIAQDAQVTIGIFNIAGELIRRIELGNQNAGWYVTKDRAAYWNGRNNAGEGVASGIYFYKLRAGKYSAVRKMLIVK